MFWLFEHLVIWLFDFYKQLDYMKLELDIK